MIIQPSPRLQAPPKVTIPSTGIPLEPIPSHRRPHRAAAAPPSGMTLPKPTSISAAAPAGTRTSPGYRVVQDPAAPSHPSPVSSSAWPGSMNLSDLPAAFCWSRKAPGSGATGSTTMSVLGGTVSSGSRQLLRYPHRTHCWRLRRTRRNRGIDPVSLSLRPRTRDNSPRAPDVDVMARACTP